MLYEVTQAVWSMYATGPLPLRSLLHLTICAILEMSSCLPPDFNMANSADFVLLFVCSPDAARLTSRGKHRRHGSDCTHNEAPNLSLRKDWIPL